jgi:hypothetical protein
MDATVTEVADKIASVDPEGLADDGVLTGAKSAPVLTRLEDLLSPLPFWLPSCSWVRS